MFCGLLGRFKELMESGFAKGEQFEIPLSAANWRFLSASGAGLTSKPPHSAPGTGATARRALQSPEARGAVSEAHILVQRREPLFSPEARVSTTPTLFKFPCLVTTFLSPASQPGDPEPTWHKTK